jgi:dTDP-glucose 4,6-dehydratase
VREVKTLNRRILVTGGAGFIGSHFIKLILLTTDYLVVNFDSLTYAGNKNNLSEVSNNPNYHFIKGDIRDKLSVIDAIRTFNINTIVNFAAESHVDRSIQSSDDFISTNILGSQVLMDASRHFWQEEDFDKFKKDALFIQVSTDEVYGSIEFGEFNENSSIQPNSPYAASKAAADLIARSYYKTYGFPVIVTRCSNNYGENQYPEKLIPYFISLAKNNKPLEIYGDGTNIRDWIHVKDHCLAIKTIIDKGVVGEIYNIGSNNERTNIEISEMILKLLGKPLSLINFVKDRPGHDKRYAISAEKIRIELGWRPTIDFYEAMKDLIQNS